MSTPSRDQSVRRVLILTLITNIVVAVAKLLVGLVTGSIAMVADGIHSSMDALSNVVGLIGNWIASRPPDEDHPYGHRRFETLASMIIGGILVLTAWEITKSSIDRLVTGDIPSISSINFIAMLITLVINLSVTTYEHREAKRLNSELLRADAEHTRSDVFVSLTVIASLIAVKLGLAWVDAAAALIVVALIGRAAWRIVSSSINVLVDRAVLQADEVSAIVRDVAGVQQVLRVRSRGPAIDIHLDLDVQVTPPTTTGQSASIADEIRRRLRENFKGLSDIQIHFIPLRNGSPDYPNIARAEGDALGLGVHEVIPTLKDGRLVLDMHVEVAPDQSVGEAHALVTQFEERMMDRLPELIRIVTHIEPAHTCEDTSEQDRVARQLARQALQIAQRLYPDNHWHDLDIRAESDGGFALSMHCHVEEDMPLEDAHRLAETVETQVRAAIPALHRLTIHTEPSPRR